MAIKNNDNERHTRPNLSNEGSHHDPLWLVDTGRYWTQTRDQLGSILRLSLSQASVMKANFNVILQSLLSDTMANSCGTFHN